MVKKVTNLLNKKNSLAAASVILMITLSLSNLLGFVRDHYLTQKIPTDLLSVYYAAFRIPDLIFNVLILGAITSAFIPIFTNLVAHKKEQEAWEVASSIVNIAFIVLVGFSLILAIFMPYLTQLVVPGFSPERQVLTSNLGRIMLFSPIFFGLSYVFGGILNSYKRFLIYSLAPLVYNVVIILGILFFADRFSVYGVAYAVIAGAFLHMLIQLPSAIRLGFRFNFKINWSNWAVRRIGILMIPRAIALGSNQIMLLVFTGIASGLGGYSIAVYNLADNIQTMPLVVFGTSFATAIFPTLSEAFSHNKLEEFSTQIKKITRNILFFMIPIAIMIVMLRMQIVRLIFGSGHFGWDQTIATANTMAYFAISLAFAGLLPLFSRAYYAMHNTKIPMIVTIVGAILSIILGKLLSLKMGVEGLALGYSVGSIVSVTVIYIMLSRKIELFRASEITAFVLKVLLSALFMALVMQLVKNLIGESVDMDRAWGVGIQTLAALGFGVVIYLIFARIFQLKEIEAVSVFLQRFNRRDVV